MSSATRHSAVLIAAFAITALLNYAFGVGLSWFLTPAQYGVLGVAQSLLLLAALAVGAGFPWAAAHELAGTGVSDRSRRRFRTAWVANVVLGMLLAALLWGAYQSGRLPLGPAYRQIVPLIAITTLLLAARAAMNGAARGSYKFGPVAANMVADAALKAGIGMALVAAGAGVTGVISGFALATALTLAHSLWMIRPEGLWQGKGWFDRQVVQTTIPLFLSMVGPALILNLDILGLKILAPAENGDQLAGLYQAAVILARTPVFVAQSLTLVLFSYVARSSINGGRGAAAHYLKTAIKIWLRLLLPGGLVLILAPGTVLSVFFPAQYLESSLALQIAAGGGLLLALLTLLNGIFQASGDRRRPAAVSAAAALAQVVLLILFVPVLGANAAALSLLVAGALGVGGLAPLIVSYAGVHVSRLVRTVGQQVYRLGLPLLGLAVPLLAFEDSSPGEAVLKLVFAVAVYLAFLWITNYPGDLNRDRPVRNLVTQFVNVLMGA